ncbi:hypothetical protein [Riemerella anatipestifer]|uniref:TonB-dependent receptor plug domain-containing protein n=3 Tax=Riemerella anatipestifer TaxID=34085 RepID=H8MC18_RIEAD|nr:hypothetical protein [Riemerella anatipestifer]AGC40894.1 hypothetical protein G148_1590 [Riemerella anatipestifer RA-CH-2]AKQ38791.1 hypothetical protein AS87_00195 [Riemerella anatipestifer Yb2]AFD55253.1 hypothetical protein RA0C_0245 [Riemerella anatipestifer ATCC 11845 = DSM 15868]AKP68531.1 hypothetical protein CG08_0041 [Riemerella anatipestifer]AKP70343.1 hypothetical protein CG09_0041 [Riemerella anatipestifer]
MIVEMKLKVLSVGVLFLGIQSIVAQEAKKDSIREIEEVVVLGYTKVKKENYAGTATTVDMKSVESKNVSSISQALVGEACGSSCCYQLWSTWYYAYY